MNLSVISFLAWCLVVSGLSSLATFSYLSLYFKSEQFRKIISHNAFLLNNYLTIGYIGFFSLYMAFYSTLFYKTTFLHKTLVTIVLVIFTFITVLAYFQEQDFGEEGLVPENFNDEIA